MLYTIFGYNQKIAVELNLSMNDLLLLNWIRNFIGSKKMVNITVDGEIYYWVDHKNVTTELPITKWKKDTVYNILKNMVDKKVLNKKLDAQKQHTYYKFGEAYWGLLTDTKDEASENNPYPLGKLSDPPSEKYPTNSNTNDSLINDSNNALSLVGKTSKISKTPLEKQIDDYTSDAQLKQVLLDFVASRKARHRPMTPQALKLALKKLDALIGDKVAIVERSILKSYDTFYELQSNDRQNSEAKQFGDKTPPTTRYQFVESNSNPFYKEMMGLDE